MRYTSFVVVAALVVMHASVGAGETVPAAELRQNLLSTCFVDPQEGWAVGDLGRVFHTTDGAKTWDREILTSAQLSMVALACPDKGHLWAAGQVGTVAFSGDGGKTWTAQKSGTDRQLLGLAFADARHGIAVGDFGTLLHTDDGGSTWTKVPLPSNTKLPPDVAEVVDPGDVVLYAVTFLDLQHAWAVGEFGVMLFSSDGGTSWQPLNSPVETSLFGVSFADAQHGWAVGLESTLLATTDGGTSWRKLGVETPEGFSISLYDIQVHGNYGWAVGNSGYLLNTKDAGTTWQRVQVPVQMSSSWFRGVSLLPDGRGFLVGARGLVLAADRDSYTALRQRLSGM